MNVSLTNKQIAYIASQIEQGDYQNASELVRDALRLHQLYRERVLRELQQEIAKAWDAEEVDGGVMDVVRSGKKKYRKKGKE